MLSACAISWWCSLWDRRWEARSRTNLVFVRRLCTLSPNKDLKLQGGERVVARLGRSCPAMIFADVGGVQIDVIKRF